MFSLFKSRSVKARTSHQSDKPLSIRSKKNLMAMLSDKLGATQKDISSVYAELLNVIQEELQAHGEIRLSGIGKLISKKRGDRSYYNPTSKKMIKVAGSNVVRFRPAVNLQRCVNIVPEVKKAKKK